MDQRQELIDEGKLGLEELTKLVGTNAAHVTTNKNHG